MRLFDRFLKLLGRLRLWHQFALLGLFVVIAPIVSTSVRFFNDGRRILTEHEIIDLSDDSNLRVNEVREEFAYLTRDVAQDSRALGKALNGGPVTDDPKAAQTALTRIARGWEQTVPELGDRPASVAHVRHRFFGGTLVQLFAVTLTPGAPLGVEVVATVGPDGNPLPPGPTDPVLLDALRDLAHRTTRELPTYVSDPHLQPPTPDRPARCVVALGWPARWIDRRAADLLVVVIDFTRYISNRARTSPRHQFIVTRPDGTLLVHPDPVLVAEGARVQDVIPWPYPDRAFLDSPEDPRERNLRHARMVREGGVRLAGVPDTTLAHYYRKGHFSVVLEEVLGDAAPDALKAINQQLAAVGRGDTRFRFGELTPSSSYVELSHPDRARIEQASKVVDDWWRAVRGPRSRVSWTSPLECRTFQGQLTHLRMDENDEAEPPRLIVAAALEELHEDINYQFGRIIWRWVLPTVAISAVLTVALVMVLTRSLRRLAASAKTLSDLKAPVEVAGGGCREVTLLATALREMATRLRDDAARFQTILRAAGEGIVVASGDGTIEEANRAAAHMFGHDRPEDLIGRRVAELVADPVPDPGDPEPEPDPLAGASALTTRGGPFYDAIRGVRKDGSVFWLEVTMRPVALRDRQVVTCVFRDVSQKKAAEEQIKSMNEELENRVRLRTAELAEANTKLEVALRQAEAAGRAKDTFVANMSHELRQPLHIIIGFTEALKEEAEDAGRTELIPDLNKILAAARHLLDLINDLLDLAKISSGRMELNVARFDLDGLVRDVRTLVAPLAEKNQNVFLVDAPPDLGSMTADERRVRQILINLLSNAFKFTHHGKVTLRVRRVEEAGEEWVEFAVSDTGKGMTPDQVGRLFQRFYQADPTTTREHGGTGLGLAITQSFNDLLGGQPIRVTSVPGRGSEFVVRLPSEVSPDTGQLLPRHTPLEVPALTAADNGEPPPAGGTVLVIDDDPAVLELMGRFLGKEGFRVVPATSGADGLRLAKQIRPVAITLDVMMPGTDGWAVLADLKADPETCDIPVVVLTIVDDRGRGYALGAADYLTKPIDWQRLGAILRRYHPPGRPAPVLIVDDDPECRELVRRNLEAEGWRVTEAADGEAGLRMVAADPPALVLLDLMMPGVDGFAFLEEFPKRFPGGRTPVIVLTAKDLTADDYTRLNGRVARILAKGNLARLDELMALVRGHARQAKTPASIPTDATNAQTADR
jgi:PAS domain S-box-containing protein